MKKMMNCFNQEIKEILFNSSNINDTQLKLEKLSCSNEIIIDVILECLATIDSSKITNDAFKLMLEFVKNNKSDRSAGALTVALLMFAESKDYMHVKSKDVMLVKKLSKEIKLIDQLAKARKEFEKSLTEAQKYLEENEEK